MLHHVSQVSLRRYHVAINFISYPMDPMGDGKEAAKKMFILPRNSDNEWCNNHLEKYEFVNGKDDIPCIMEK